MQLRTEIFLWLLWVSATHRKVFLCFLSCLFLVVSKKLIFKETLLIAHLLTLHPPSVNFGRRRLPKRCLHGWLIFGTSSVGIFVEAWVYLSVPGPHQYLAAWKTIRWSLYELTFSGALPVGWRLPELGEWRRDKDWGWLNSLSSHCLSLL